MSAEKKSWSEDARLPAGWRVGVAGAGLRDPAGRVFPAHTELGEQQRLELRTALLAAGWREDDFFPAGWLLSQDPRTRTFSFITAECELIDYDTAMDRIDENNDQSQDGEVNLNAKCVSVKKEIDIKAEKQGHVKVEKKAAAPFHHIAADGREFHTAVDAFVHMIASGESLAARAEFVDCVLQPGGWGGDRGLPPGWLHRMDAFISQDGSYFENGDWAVQFLEQSGRAVEAGQVREWREKNSLTWTENETEAKKITCSNGMKFHGRISALKYLMSNNFPNSVEQRMREEMLKEGWKADEKLPFDWMVRVRTNELGVRKGSNFIDEFGNYYRSAKDAVESMKISGKYSDEEINHINSSSSSPLKKEPNLIKQETIKTEDSQTNSWEFHPSLPTGWSTRAFGRKRYYKAENGKSFVSKPAALEYMQSSGDYSEEQIEKLKFKKNQISNINVEVPQKNVDLSADGWLAHPDLPEQWKTRRDKKNRHFMSEAGKYFDCKATALQFMRKAEKYTDAEIEMVSKFSAVNVKFEKSNNETIENLLKPLIEIKGIKDGRSFFICPDKKRFPSRRSALAHMISSNFPSQAVEQARSSLHLDGWKEDPLLPKNWFTKVRNKGNGAERRFFLSDKAEMVSMKTLLQSETLSAIEKQQAMKIMKTHEIIRTQSRIVCLRSLIQNNYPAEEINEKRKELSLDGWTEHPMLPKNWFTKLRSNGVGKGQRRLFLSDSAEELSMKGLLESDRLSKAEKEQAMKIMKTQFIPSPHNKISVLRSMVENDQHTVEEINEKRKELSLEGWTEHPLLPVNWLTRVRNNGQGSKRRFFLSDKVEVLSMKQLLESETLTNEEKETAVKIMNQKFKLKPKTRREAFKRMMENSEIYSEEDIEKARSDLHLDGWEDHPDLPKNWKTKQRNKTRLFVSDKGYIFDRRGVAVKFMQKSGKYSQDEIDKLANFVGNKNQSQSGPLETTNKRQILKYLVANNHSEEDIEKARADLNVDGWEDNLDLPKNWKTKSRNKDRYFVSEGGMLFTRKSLAVQFMEKAGTYDPKDINKMANFCKSRNKMKKVKTLTDALRFLVANTDCPAEEIEAVRSQLHTEGWETHPELPKNWKSKRLPTDKFRYFLAENGRIFDRRGTAVAYMRKNEKYTEADIEAIQSFALPPNRKTAHRTINPGNRREKLKFLVENNHSEEEIEKVRAELHLDNWEEHPALPKNWRTKRSKTTRNRIFLSETGHSFDRKGVAVVFMKKHERYTESDMELIMKFGVDPAMPPGPPLLNFDKKPKNRREILKFAVENKHSDEDIEKARSELCLDGWEDHPELPQNWKTKESKKNRYFASDGGKLFGRKSAAVQFMKDNEFGQDEIEKLEKFFPKKISKKEKKKKMKQEKKEKKKKEKEEKKDQIKKEKKEKKKEGRKEKKKKEKMENKEEMIKKEFIDEEKETIVNMENTETEDTKTSKESNNYREHLKSLIDNVEQHSTEEIEQARANLHLEGWRDHPALPRNWKTRCEGGKRRFVTDTGRSFQRRVEMVNYMKNSGKYSEEELEMIAQLSAKNFEVPQKRKYNKKKIKVSTENPEIRQKRKYTKRKNKENTIKSNIEEVKKEIKDDENTSSISIDTKLEEQLSKIEIVKEELLSTLEVTSMSDIENPSTGHPAKKIKLGELKDQVDDVYDENNVDFLNEDVSDDDSDVATLAENT